MTVTDVESDVDEQHPLFFDMKNSQVTFSQDPSLKVKTKADAATSSSSVLRLDAAGIGGLHEQIETVNDNLALISSTSFPLENPRFRGPTSFLFHGPEGCGKSLLLKRLSAAPWRKVYKLDQDWLAAHRKEQAVALSEDVFEASLNNQPALILIDNLDKFLKKAENLVEQLQEELEKLQNTRVVVAAATRRIYDIDATLRSHSGLRIELELFAPNVKQREDIIRQLLSHEHMDPEFDYTSLAEQCHGFVGRDIIDLISKARWNHDTHLRKSLDGDGQGTLNDVLKESTFVTQEDFNAVISQIQPTVLKDSIIEVPKVKWADIAGVDHVRSLLESIVVRPYKVSSNTTSACRNMSNDSVANHVPVSRARCQVRRTPVP